jgi:hypothetical protein
MYCHALRTAVAMALAYTQQNVAQPPHTRVTPSLRNGDESYSSVAQELLRDLLPNRISAMLCVTQHNIPPARAVLPNVTCFQQRMLIHRRKPGRQQQLELSLSNRPGPFVMDGDPPMRVDGSPFLYVSRNALAAQFKYVLRSNFIAVQCPQVRFPVVMRSVYFQFEVKTASVFDTFISEKDEAETSGAYSVEYACIGDVVHA